MPQIKTIKVDGVIYDIKATYDGAGKNIEQTYASTAELEKRVEKVDGKALSSNDFTTLLKNKLDGIADNANKYVHPATVGNKHIPSGGVTGQILVNSADGTAQWQDSTTKLDAKFLELSNLIAALRVDVDALKP